MIPEIEGEGVTLPTGSQSHFGNASAIYFLEEIYSPTDGRSGG